MSSCNFVKRMLIAVTLVCVAGAFAAPSWAQAPSPNVVAGGNLFLVEGFFDPSPFHVGGGVHLICYTGPIVLGVGQITGNWFALTFPDWNGRYYQEGDLVRMHGDFGGPIGIDRGHDHMRFNLATTSFSDSGTGDWDEWLENGGFGITIAFGNIRMTRVGFCPVPVLTTANPSVTGEAGSNATAEQTTEDEDLNRSRSVPERLTKDGRVPQGPGDPELEDVKDYLVRTGQTDLLEFLPQ